MFTITSRPHYTPEEFENGDFTVKTRQMNSVHTTSEEFKNATITRHFGFLFKETRPERSRDYPKTIFFVMLRFQNVVRPHENEKPGVFEMLRSRDGLVWTVGLTVEVVLNFQIPPALCGRGLRLENREC